MGERQLQIRTRLPQQCAGEGGITTAPAINPATAVVATHIQPVGQLGRQRAATAEAQTCGVLAAHGHADLVLDGTARRLLRHDVDDPANGTIAMDDRGRTAQHFDALDGPGIERKGDAHAAILAQPVIQAHHGSAIGEATAGQRTQAVARVRHRTDRTGAADRIIEVGVAALLQLLARNHRQAGRCLQHAQAQRRPGAGGGRQFTAAGVDHTHGIQRGRGCRIGGKYRGGVQEQRAHGRQRRPAQARGVGVRFHLFTACKATLQWQGSNQKGTDTRVRAPAVAGNLMKKDQCTARVAQAAMKAGGPRAPNVPLTRCGNACTAPRSARHIDTIGANSSNAATSRVISRAAIRQ